MTDSQITRRGLNMDAPYRTAEQAIRHAYRIESQEVVKVSSYFSQLLGGTVKLPGEVRSGDPYDDHAQAALMLMLVERTLLKAEALTIRARHAVPKSGMLETRKLCDTMLLFEWFVRKWSGPRVPRRYAEDVLRGWVGYKRHHTEKWWADHLGMDARTLRYWRNGDTRRRRGSDGFMDAIEFTYGSAINKLTSALFEAGFTRE